ncbi:MAG: antibiotic biosynthesis monooxygenase [Gammaproteobacteria bacterium]
MVIILGTIKVASTSELEKVRAALVRRAARSKADQGNIEYEFTVSIEDPTEIRLTEVWESEQALTAHLAIPDEDFTAVLATTDIVSAVVTAYDASNKRVLMER